MRWLARLVLLPLGLLFAIPAGLLALAIAAVLDPITSDLARIVVWTGAMALADAAADGEAAISWGQASALGWASTLLVAPPVFTALIGEVAGLRSPVWYGGATGALTAAMPWLMRGRAASPAPAEMHLTLVLFAVGASAGLVYWLIAGRGAGAPRPLSAPAASGS